MRTIVVVLAHLPAVSKVVGIHKGDSTARRQEVICLDIIVVTAQTANLPGQCQNMDGKNNQTVTFQAFRGLVKTILGQVSERNCPGQG